MQNILHEVTKDMTRQVFIRQGDSSNIREVLKEAKSKSWTNIIVDMNISNTAILLRTVGVISLGYPENKLLFFKVKITEFYFLERTLFFNNVVYLHSFIFIDGKIRYGIQKKSKCLWCKVFRKRKIYLIKKMVASATLLYSNQIY